MKEAVLIVVVGPTAVGKTAIAVELAKLLNCEILSADSRQFYKEMSIGTAKPTSMEMQNIPHHFINHLSIQEEYSAGKFEQEALKKLDELFYNNDKAILVGGSGLFVNALCFGLDDIPKTPLEIRNKLNETYQKYGIAYLQNKVKEIDEESFKRIDIQNPQRLIRVLEVYETCGIPLSKFQSKASTKRNFKCLWIGLNMDREKLYHRINQRVDLMIKEGLLEEVIGLENFKQLNPLKTVGYQEFYDVQINNKNELDSAIEKVKQNSRRYAKRQLTWFRKNKEITWFNPNDLGEIVLWVNQQLNAKPI